MVSVGSPSGLTGAPCKRPGRVTRVQPAIASIVITLSFLSLSATPAAAAIALATSTATGTLAVSLGVGATSMPVNVTSACPFAVTGPSGSNGPGDITLKGVDVGPALSVSAVQAGQQVITLRATTAVHAVAEAVSQANVPDCGTVPAAPSNITATAINSSTIQVTWTNNASNATGLVISDNLTSVTLGAGTTSYTWSGLAPNTYKCSHVYAYNSAGNSAWSGWACTTTPAAGLSWSVSLSASSTSPAANQNVTLTASTNHDVGPTAYGLYIVDTTNGQQQNCSSGTSCQWTVAYSGTTHSFVARVGMFAGTQTQATSNIVSVSWAASFGGGTREQHAVTWALQQLGSTGWDNPARCELFVENAFGTQGKYATAYANYQAMLGLGQIHTDQNVPAGALAFFAATNANGNGGHVMLSLGNGLFVSSSVGSGSSAASPKALVTSGQVGYTSIALAASSSGSYVGWSWANTAWPGR